VEASERVGKGMSVRGRAEERATRKGADIISEAWIHAGRRPPKEDDGDDEDDDDNDDDNGITRTTMQ
jgi:hypothetical protein